MHPVMQQTNVIHVAQGGTVILPGQSQNTQVNHQPNISMTNQARSLLKFHLAFKFQYSKIFLSRPFKVSSKSRKRSRKILPGHQRSK